MLLEKKSNALVIDASGLLYRSFFALPPLTSPQGRPTGALYGFIRSLLKVIQKTDPTYMVAVFDAKGNKDSRLKIFPEYKAHRKPTPPELIEQIEEAKKFCSLFGIPLLSKEGVEADDTISAVVRKNIFPTGGIVYICSADKDLAQLVNDTTYIINPAKDDAIFDREAVKREWNLFPEELIDYFALIGDASDNIPGIEGIGPKTALELLSTWKSLEGILDNADLIPGKKGEKVRAGKILALLSKKLVTLDDTVPVPEDASFYTRKEEPQEPIVQFIRDNGFKTLESLVASKNPVEGPAPCSTTIVKNKEEFDAFLEWLKSTKEITLDCETTSVDEYTAQLVGIGIAENPDHVFYIHCFGPIPAHNIVSAISNVIITNNISLCGHNIKYDLHVLSRYGFDTKAHVSFDTLVASWILYAHERSHNLDELARRHFHKEKISIESLLGKGKKAKTMAEVPVEAVARYCAEDVEYTVRLKHLFSEELKKENLKTLFETIEMPLLPILLHMEQNGIYVNVNHLKSLHQTIMRDLKVAEGEIFSFAGHEFNINSPKQLSTVLFDELHLPKGRKGKQHSSTNADILEDLALSHPIAQKILEYRGLDKLRSTYVETLPTQINPQTLRVHCHFTQSGTATGRLSCQDPNLQNIPVKSELGKEIRAAFEPQKKGWVYISADYSQMELRILAHISQDPVLMKAFRENLDVHAMTAAELFSVPLSQVTEDMRRKAKAVNFGVIYGQQAYGLAKELHIPQKEAQAFIDHYFARYTKVLSTVAQAKEKAHKTGMAESLLGRKRLLPDINSSDFFIRASQERLAINTPFQGTAADMIKIAMIRVNEWLCTHHMKTMMIVQIHDELLFEAPEEEVEGVVPAIRTIMESAMNLSVPLRVDITIGKNWKEC